jgi:predicted PurR-regulated permease PerM
MPTSEIRPGAGTDEPASVGVPEVATRPPGRPDPPATVISLDQASVVRAGLTVMLLICGLLLVLWLFSVTRHFLFLIMLAWLFAIALEPGIRWLVRRGRSRGLSAAIVGGSALLGCVLLAAVFGKLFFEQLASFVRSLPGLTESTVTWVNDTFHTHLDASHIASSLSVSPSQIATTVESLTGGILGVVGSMVAVLFDLVTVIVFGFYFAADGPRVLRGFASSMPPRAQRVFLTVSEISVTKTGGYVVSKILLAALSAFFHGVFFFALGVPYWLPFALLVGVTAQFVPIVGTYIGVLLPVLATVFDSPWKAVGIIAFAVVYQQVETYFLTPRISKRTMDVNPAIALAAVFVGGAIWGPLGAIIGIPLAAAAVAVLGTYRRRYELIPELAGEADLLVENDTPSRSTSPEEQDARLTE